MVVIAGAPRFSLRLVSATPTTTFDAAAAAFAAWATAAVRARARRKLVTRHYSRRVAARVLGALAWHARHSQNARVLAACFAAWKTSAVRAKACRHVVARLAHYYERYARKVAACTFHALAWRAREQAVLRARESEWQQSQLAKQPKRLRDIFAAWAAAARGSAHDRALLGNSIYLYIQERRHVTECRTGLFEWLARRAAFSAVSLPARAFRAWAALGNRQRLSSAFSKWRFRCKAHVTRCNSVGAFNGYDILAKNLDDVVDALSMLQKRGRWALTWKKTYSQASYRILARFLPTHKAKVHYEQVRMLAGTNAVSTIAYADFNQEWKTMFRGPERVQKRHYAHGKLVFYSG